MISLAISLSSKVMAFLQILIILVMLMSLIDSTKRQRIPHFNANRVRYPLSYLTAKKTSTLLFSFIVLMSITSVMVTAFSIIVTTTITLKWFRLSSLVITAAVMPVLIIR